VLDRGHREVADPSAEEFEERPLPPQRSAAWGSSAKKAMRLPDSTATQRQHRNPGRSGAPSAAYPAFAKARRMTPSSAWSLPMRPLLDSRRVPARGSTIDDTVAPIKAAPVCGGVRAPTGGGDRQRGFQTETLP
jgi:hypothetical protein